MQHIDETEDGEISDDSDIEPYTALERPTSFTTAHQPFKQVAEDTDEASESSSSSDESSSDEQLQRPAKRRRKAETKALKPAQPVVKHNVWSTVVFEDQFEQDIKDINVHHSKNYLDRSRDVESYNYVLCMKNRLEEEDIDEKTEQRIRKKIADLDEKYGGGDPVKVEKAVDEDFEQSLQQTQTLLNSRKRKMDQRDQQPQSTAPKSKVKARLRRVEELSVTEKSSVMEVAQDIALKLHEEKMDLILRVVEILGKEITIKLFYETQETENDGGIMVADGSRRRTPGGVFLYLLRNHEEIPMEKIREIFSEETKAKEQHKRTLRAKRRQTQADKLKKSLPAPNTLPELPTRVELEMQKSQQDAQPTATEPLMKSDNETMMEQQPIQSEIAESEVLDCTDIHFDSE
ncbi:phosphorylated adapter RNA export protein-like [Daphnia pulicaria]|uniref:phosphorylated adapter RNA export protein-like n=1 Tax=Daphnia pulicaria TaxID=35523 RepID=UPI001EEBEA1F|nr:phosphorylated adapter RNA export protein-like [Daphnia pulicaria]